MSTTLTSPIIKQKKQRIDVIDVMRGYAVMAIMLIHNIEHFNYYHYPDKALNPTWLNTLNEEVLYWVFFLFAGKTYSIFAILFGFTFYLMNNKQKEMGKDFGPRYLWRLLLLVGFALFNAAFFPGEVLMLYALTGPILFVVRKWSNKALLIAALFFLSQPFDLLQYVYSLINPEYTVSQQLFVPLWKEAMAVIKEGNFFDTMCANLTLGQGFSLLWAIENGRAVQTMGLFILGFWLGNVGAFKAENYNQWKKVLVAAVLTMIPLFFIKEHFTGSEVSEVIKRSLGVAFDMYWKVSFTFIWISLIVLIYKNKTVVKWSKPLQTYGKMSLTNYITQSIFGGILYFGYGFHLADTCGVAFSLLIGFGFLAVQMLFCHYWLKNHKQGPFESLWHQLTWNIPSKK
ncbi:DUF418 domain-containing protein [Flammeovirga agarivorans]|uniref:DUF418 domain-containing protein n=1 Tax=Flammeovirga agarivorans TaxID=2726742 RepID=A0A7X8XW62_9BACT|nr:DUF418 domain-containing protein [Flammeovirga agarivorans]NLR91775.1 DUF418 domain-containing protein [Flammeovirga agarivorans]